jgi:hypothetical protein
MSELTENMKDWLRNGERGISSETIFEALTGIPLVSGVWGYSTPRDPSDFYRCYKLLKAVPEFRNRIKEVGEQFPHWKPLVENWDELEVLLEEELKRSDDKAPKLYNRIHELNGDD